MGFFTLEAAQAQLSPGGNFGPWIWDLKLRVEQVSAEELRIRLPFDDRIARPGGVVIGQAMMAMADTAMVLAICEKVGRFATLATAFGEVEMFADGSAEPIAQSLSTFAVLPDGAGAFNRADSHAG